MPTQEHTTPKRGKGTTPDPVELPAMTPKEARECVKRIKGCLDQARELILELHDRKGWKSLGHSSWQGCVRIEFAQCRDTLYKQLEAAKVAKEIESVENFDTSAMPDSHLRVLAPVPNEKRMEVYREAVAESGGKPTATKIAAKLQEFNDRIEKECENPPVPFASDAEMKAAFKDLLAMQDELEAVREKCGYNFGHCKEYRDAEEKMRHSHEDFISRIPCPESADHLAFDYDRKFVIVIDGITYAGGGYNYGWSECEVFNLDAAGRKPRGASK